MGLVKMQCQIISALVYSCFHRVPHKVQMSMINIYIIRSLSKTNRQRTMRISSGDEEIEPTKLKSSSLTLPKTPPPNSDAKIMSVSDVSPVNLSSITSLLYD